MRMSASDAAIAAGGRRVWIMFCWADPFGSGRSSSACRSQTVPAPTRPEALRLSGGYVGAKRVIWQMAHNANSVAKERGLDVHFQVLLPLQLVGDTGLGRTVATAYAERDGTTVEDHLVKRYGMPFLPKQYGQEVAEELLTSNAAKPIREQSDAYQDVRATTRAWLRGRLRRSAPTRRWAKQHGASDGYGLCPAELCSWGSVLTAGPLLGP